MIFFAYILIGTLPGVYIPFTFGLDPSWQWAINYLPHCPIEYGRDIIHPYGPLGFLLVTGELADNVPIAFAFWITVQFIAGLALWRIRAQMGGAPSYLFAFVFLAGASTGLWAEYHLLLVATICLFAAGLSNQERTKEGIGLGIAGGVLFAILPFVKWSVAFWSVPAVLFYCITCTTSRTRRNLPLALSTLSGHVIALSVLSVCYFRNWPNLLTAVRLGFASSAEISIAMSLAGPDAATLAACVCLLVLIPALAYLAGVEDIALLLFAAPLLLAFKHGFSRQDGHMTAFFGLAATTCAIPFLYWARSPRHKLIAILAAVVCIPSSIGCGLRFESIPPLTARQYLRNLSGLAGMRKLGQVTRLSEFRASLRRVSEENLAHSRLPRAWIELVRAHGQEIDSLPGELSVIPANGLTWKPNPSLQLFTAYTRELDAFVAAHFASPRRPEFLIVKHEVVDERLMVFDTPLTWLTVLAHYRSIAADLQEERLLLRHGKNERDFAGTVPSVLSHQTIRFGETITVPRPPAGRMMLAALSFRRTYPGELLRAVFRVPRIRMEIHTTSGRRLLVHVTPATAESGLLLSPLVSDFASLHDAFDGVARESVARFRLLPDARASYRDSVVCEWRTVEWLSR